LRIISVVSFVAGLSAAEDIAVRNIRAAAAGAASENRIQRRPLNF